MNIDVLNRVLVHIQANLDADISLSALAAEAGLSSYHFEREFGRLVGESVKQYTLRLRLERAAIRLLLHQGTILDIALEHGFESHETFTRAFKRRFDITPREHRRRGLGGVGNSQRHRAREGTEHYALSPVKIYDTQEMYLAFIRHTGPYENVPDTLWTELAAWARRRHVAGPRVLLGIGHDAPEVTPVDKLRFDAALRLPEPMTTRGKVGYQRLPARTYAMATHAGPYSTLPVAYPQVFAAIAARSDCQLEGLPIVEVYHATEIKAQAPVNHTDIYVPVRRVSPRTMQSKRREQRK